MKYPNDFTAEYKGKKYDVVFHEALGYILKRPFAIKTDTLLTVTEAAEKLGIHPESVRRLIRQGRIKAEKHGNSYLISSSIVTDMERWYSGKTGKNAWKR